LLLFGLFAIASLLLWLHLWKERRWKSDFTEMLNGEVEIAAISFEGQQRKIIVNDRDILHDIQIAFTNRGLHVAQSGITYSVIVTLMSGRNIPADIFLYTDGSGFAVADCTHIVAGDPMMINAEFSPESSEKTKALVNKLLVVAIHKD
jgi:hypothetical protein